jgi:hypothetical protein
MTANGVDAQHLTETKRTGSILVSTKNCRGLAGTCSVRVIRGRAITARAEVAKDAMAEGIDSDLKV